MKVSNIFKYSDKRSFKLYIERYIPKNVIMLKLNLKKIAEFNVWSNWDMPNVRALS